MGLSNRFYVSALLSSYFLGSCSPSFSPKTGNTTVKIAISKSSPTGLETRAMSDAYCYAFNITGAHASLQNTGAASSCTNAAGGVGLIQGPYSYGEQVEIIVPTIQNVRFDLLAYNKPSSGCSGKFDLTKNGSSGNFEASVDGSSVGSPRLVASNTMNISLGSNLITLVPLESESASVIGKTYSCSKSAPTIAGVSQDNTDPQKLVVIGTGLDAATGSYMVAPSTIGGATTTFAIESKTATQLVLKASSIFAAALGQTYQLVIQSAQANTSTEVTFTLANGSIKPAHLDMTQSGWPFQLMIPIKNSDLPSQSNIFSSFTGAEPALPLSSDFVSMFDNNETTSFSILFDESLSYNDQSSYQHGAILFSETPIEAEIHLKIIFENTLKTGYAYTNCSMRITSTLASNYSEIYSGGADNTAYISGTEPPTYIKINGTGKYLEYACNQNCGTCTDGETHSIEGAFKINELRIFKNKIFD